MGHTVFFFVFLGKHESLYWVPLLRDCLILNPTTNPTPTNCILEFSTLPAQEVCPVREELARNHDAVDTRLFVERFVAKTDRAEDVGPQLPVFFVWCSRYFPRNRDGVVVMPKTLENLRELICWHAKSCAAAIEGKVFKVCARMYECVFDCRYVYMFVCTSYANVL